MNRYRCIPGASKITVAHETVEATAGQARGLPLNPETLKT